MSVNPSYEFGKLLNLIEAAVTEMRMVLAEFDKQHVVINKEIRCCIMCEHHKNKVCLLCGMTPPDNVLANGCDKFILDDIPF